MTLTPVVKHPSSKLISLALAGSFVFSAGGGTGSTSSQAHAQTSRTWLTVTRSSLCRIWVTPTTFNRHCTANWYMDRRGNIISGDPNWVPVAPVSDPLDVALAWPHYMPHPVQKKSVAPRLAVVYHKSAAAPSVQMTASVASGKYGLWTPPPGHPAYALADYAGDPNASYYGTCTWYAQYRRLDERLMDLGNAAQWAYNAPSHGLRVGTTPVVGATVVFQPGVFGASSSGHVGHVEAVYGGGWFLISEMNMYWNGGGFGRVSFRYIVTAPGVSFIY